MRVRQERRHSHSLAWDALESTHVWVWLTKATLDAVGETARPILGSVCGVEWEPSAVSASSKACISFHVRRTRKQLLVRLLRKKKDHVNARMLNLVALHECTSAKAGFGVGAGWLKSQYWSSHFQISAVISPVRKHVQDVGRGPHWGLKQASTVGFSKKSNI